MTRSLLAAAVAVTAVGCSTLPPEARQQLRRSLQLYQTGQYDRAIEELDKFLALYGASRPAAEGFYLRAQSYLKLGRIQPARADLKRALKLSNRDDLTARVHAALGSIAYRQHNPTLACWHYQQALPGLPD
ncbi:MAG: tol-pal system YbgF family protein, partial [Phycisphaerae bacterium]